MSKQGNRAKKRSNYRSNSRNRKKQNKDDNHILFSTPLPSHKTAATKSPPKLRTMN